MNKINRKVEYALMALKHMGHKVPGELTSVKEICQVYGCPFDATSRVLQALVQKSILQSEQGAHGGYRVSRDLKKVSLYELMEVVLGPVEIAKCIQSSDTKCELIESCQIFSPIHLLNEKLIQFYKSLNLFELLKISSHPEKMSRVPLSVEKSSRHVE